MIKQGAKERVGVAFSARINSALASLLEEFPQAVLLGEDVNDPFGGAFKVTAGLSTKFGKRVFNTPISEPALTGLGNGLALSGSRPIIEIMFGDFLTLCADQIINHAAKFTWMYGDDVSLPLMIRTGNGGGKAYGPTHSQSFEGLFLGVPNLEIWSPFILHTIANVYKLAFLSNIVSIILEAKALYPVRDSESSFLLERLDYNGETLVFSNCKGLPPDVTILAHGRMAFEALDILSELFEKEVFVEIIVPARIYPFDISVLLKNLKRTGRLIIVEEAFQASGWGRYVSGSIYDDHFSFLQKPVKCLGCGDVPIGSTPDYEVAALPTGEKIMKSVMAIVQ